MASPPPLCLLCLLCLLLAAARSDPLPAWQPSPNRPKDMPAALAKSDVSHVTDGADVGRRLGSIKRTLTVAIDQLENVLAALETVSSQHEHKHSVQSSAVAGHEATGDRPTASPAPGDRPPGSSGCPNDQWMPFDGNCYWLSSHNTSWSNARAVCKAIDSRADLASIHSLEEHNFLVDTMGARYTWIGLNDLEEDGQFVWSDGSDVDYQNWYQNQPDNYRGNQHCVWIYEEFALQWDDAECPAPFAFVCKIAGAA